MRTTTRSCHVGSYLVAGGGGLYKAWRAYTDRFCDGIVRTKWVDYKEWKEYDA